MPAGRARAPWPDLLFLFIRKQPTVLGHAGHPLAQQCRGIGHGPHDPLAVAVAIDPTLVGALGCNLRVDLLGEYRGRTICDERRLSDPDKSALVALTVDAPRFLSEFKTRMARVLG